MKPNRFFILSAALLVSSLGYAQDTAPLESSAGGKSFSIRNIAFEVFAGPALTLATGSYINGAKDALKQDGAPLGAAYTLDQKMASRIVPRLGVRAGITVTDMITAGAGLVYTQSGYKQTTRYAYRDPEFKYDEHTSVIRKVRIHQLQIPLWARYALADRLTLEAGFDIGITIPTQGDVNMTYQKDVFVNNARDEEWSVARRKNTASLKDNTNTIVPGLHIAANWQLSDRMFARVEFLRTGSYLTFDEGKVSALTIAASLNYRLPDLFTHE